MRNWLITTELEKPEYYNDLLIHAHSGIHEQALSLLLKYVPIDKEILDVGAGAGAFTQRMTDAHYKVSALDLNPDEWTLNGIEFFQLDIDLGITKSLNRSFDAICCLEVIEHLENPWNLFRELYEVIRPGGFLILSTPNITSFLSRLLFMRTGEFFQFTGNALDYGHINPISDFELSLIAERIGWKIVEFQAAGYLPIFDFHKINLKFILYNFLRGISFLLSKGNKRGWVTIGVFQKPIE